MNAIIILGHRFPVADNFPLLSAEQIAKLTKIYYAEEPLSILQFLARAVKIICPKNILVRMYLYWYLFNELQFIAKLIEWIFNKQVLLNRKGEIIQTNEDITFGQFIEIDTFVRKTFANKQHLSQTEVEELVAIRFEVNPKDLKNLAPHLASPIAKQTIEDYQNLIQVYKIVFEGPEEGIKLKTAKKHNTDEWFKIIRLLADKNPLHFQNITQLSAAECLFHLKENIIEYNEQVAAMPKK